MGCVPSDEPPAYPPLGAIRSFDGDVVRFDFGAGDLTTTGNDPWGSADSILYPGSVDIGRGPVELEVQGLNLANIPYTGDMGWPPDPTDHGALITVNLVASTTISYRVFSSVSGLIDLVRDDRSMAEAGEFRAYQFQGYEGNMGPYGTHRMNLEEWGPPESRVEPNTLDFRLRYENGVVGAWVRLHASREWETGDAETGRQCPWNVAMNNALPETVDSIWTGECRVVRSGATGRPVGAWVPVSEGEWKASPQEGPASIGLSISNWQNADGPYRVAWKNVVLRGPRHAEAPSSSGGGRFRAVGSGSVLQPRGELAEVSYDAIAAGEGRPARAFLRFRSSRIDLTSEATRWVLVMGSEVRFAGEARVNGSGGYRYELLGVSVDREGGRLALQVWGPVPTRKPFYAAFGSLADGAMEIWPGETAPIP
jgi:hypothetical protein